MPTLVAILDLKISDRRSTRKAFSQRSSFGELAAHSEETLSLKLGESKEYTFNRCIFMHIRDEVTLEVHDAAGNVSTYEKVTGIFSLPTAGKVVVKVDNLSNVSMDRVIHVMRS